MVIQTRRKPVKFKLAYLLIFFYLFFFGLISVLKYNSFSYNDFDLAVHAQTLYNILHGSIESSILGVPFLGNHLNFILFLIAPIYAIFKSPITLLILQTLALGLSSYPIYVIAKEQLPERFNLLLLFSYLCYPGLGYVNLFEFHPTAFATFFISLMLYFSYRDRLGLYLLFMVLALLCQENIPLVIIPFGLYLLITGRRLKWWLITIIAGAAWFWIGAYMLIPYFGKGTIKFINIYGYLGNNINEVVRNIVIHPLQILGIILRKENLIYLNQIFGPVLFLPVLSPLTFLGAIPSLIQHLLSLRPTEHTIFYHYTAEIIPFVFFSSIFAFKRILAFYKKENFLIICLLMITVVSNWILGPHIDYLLNLNRFNKTALDYAKDTFLEFIPKKAEVVATFEFLPKLSNRRGLYSMHHAVMGTYTLSNLPYKLPETTKYALVDFEDWLMFKGSFYNQQNGKNLRRLFISGDFGIVDIVETIALFKRGVTANYVLYNILPHEPFLSNKVGAVVNSEIELIGYEVDKTEIKKGIVSFRFYWKCVDDTDRTYGAYIDVLDGRDRVIKEAIRFICYRVYPTDEWGKGQIIEEFYRLIIPMDLLGQRYQLKMGIFDFYTGKAQKIDSTVKDVIDSSMRVNLDGAYNKMI